MTILFNTAPRVHRRQWHVTLLVHAGWFLGSVCGCFMPPAWAQPPLQELTGPVVAVKDGDTLQVLAGGQAQTVRLAAIDSPERRQPHSQRAQQALAAQVAGQTVHVTYRKRDRYRRWVGQVWVGGQDVGLWLVQTGYAWHYTAYAAEQSPDDRLAYAQAQAAAQRQRLGLWADPNPMPPWDFRRQQRAKAGQAKSPASVQQ